MPESCHICQLPRPLKVAMLYSLNGFAIHGMECMIVIALALGHEKQVDESLRHVEIGDGSDKCRR